MAEYRDERNRPTPLTPRWLFMAASASLVTLTVAACGGGTEPELAEMTAEGMATALARKSPKWKITAPAPAPEPAPAPAPEPAPAPAPEPAPAPAPEPAPAPAPVPAPAPAPAPAPTATATLQWEAVSASDLAGYRVYFGTSPGSYAQGRGQGVNAGSTTSLTLNNLQPGVTYYFAVTSYDMSGNESAYSSEVLKAVN